MPRPLRLQVPGGRYHLTARGNRRSALFLDGIDRKVFLWILGLVLETHEWTCHAYCLMTTHYHLLITTPKGDLAAGMHRLNSRFAHWFNDRHGETGHVFERRYHSVLVETEEHSNWLYRYIALNPVRAGICAAAEDWRWGSYAGVVGLKAVDLPCSETTLLADFGEGEPARRSLRRLVEHGH